MENTLLQFITSLRRHGLRVSTAETLDALEVAAALGYQHRELLREGLACALAKQPEDKPRFHQCFEQFFGVTPSARAEAARQEAPGDPLPTHFPLPEDLAADPVLGDILQTPLLQAVTQGGPQAMAVAVREAAEQAGLQGMRFNTQKGIYRQRLQRALGMEQLNSAIEALRAIEREEAGTAAEWLEQRRHELDLEIRELIDHQLLLDAGAAGRAIQEQAIRNARLSALEQHHLRQLPGLIRKLAKKLAQRHRRRRRVERRGRLDMARTLRRNVAYGGVPFHTYWKKTRREQPKLVVLCDISGSVSTYARFLLLFLYSLNEVMPRIRSFVFTHQLVEVSELFDRQPPEQAMEIVNQRWGQGSSDYGDSFAMFEADHLSGVDSNTTVIVLGDGRCNHGRTGLETLRKIYHRARLVLWFNPEPRSHWNTGDSEIRRFQTACHHVAECNSLARLERLLDQLLGILR